MPSFSDPVLIQGRIKCLMSDSFFFCNISIKHASNFVYKGTQFPDNI
jgi:hypothetical protein